MDNVVVQHDKCISFPHRTLKETRPGHNIQHIVYNAFNENKKLWIVDCLKVYLEKRNYLDSDNVQRLLITFGKPHKSTSEDTISRYVIFYKKQVFIPKYTQHIVQEQQLQAR